MSHNEYQPIMPANINWIDGVPFSPTFQEKYFSKENELKESQSIFLDGNRLPERFSSLSRLFVIAETGFGTGLNFLNTVALFLKVAPENTRLHFISVEKYPLSKQELLIALQRWPELASLSTALLAQYPTATPGHHRRLMFDQRIILTLLLGDGETMLGTINTNVDAWFLDGFVPARNKAMWSKNIFKHISRLSADDATVTASTSAHLVLQGLQGAGFDMQPEPNATSTREMLIGKTGKKATQRPASGSRKGKRIAIIGAGLAGVCSAWSLTKRGHHVRIFDSQGVAQGASGNKAGVVYTTPSAHFTPQNRFYQSSYLFALNHFQLLGFPRQPDDGKLSGVLQIAKNERLAEKAVAAINSGLWPTQLLRPSIEHGHGAALLPSGGYISAPRWCQHLLNEAELSAEIRTISELKSHKGGWRLHSDTGIHDNHFDHVIIANAAACTKFINASWLKLKNIRGQVSYVEANQESLGWEKAFCHAGYLTPALSGVHCVGATFDLHDQESNAREEDNRKNLQQLKQYLPDHYQQLGGDNAHIVSQRVGFRCQSTDFLPLVGSLGEVDPSFSGLWLNVAHGSRGITSTPLCAELLTSSISEEPLPVDNEMVKALAPMRFFLRQNKQLKHHR